MKQVSVQQNGGLIWYTDASQINEGPRAWVYECGLTTAPYIQRFHFMGVICLERLTLHSYITDVFMVIIDKYNFQPSVVQILGTVTSYRAHPLLS